MSEGEEMTPAEMNEVEKAAAKLDADFKAGGAKRKAWQKYILEKLLLEKEDVEGVTKMATARSLSWRAATASLMKKKEQEQEKAGSATKRQRSK